MMGSVEGHRTSLVVFFLFLPSAGDGTQDLACATQILPLSSNPSSCSTSLSIKKFDLFFKGRRKPQVEDTYSGPHCLLGVEINFLGPCCFKF